MKKGFLLLLCTVTALSMFAEDRFYINDFSISPGETKQVEIMLDNTTTFTAIQADIYLPEGLTIEQEDGDYLFDLTSRKGRDHTISSRVLSSGAIRILVASQNLKTFSGNSGALVIFNITADASITGNKVIEMKNVIASEVNQTEHSLPNTSCTVTVDGYEPPVGGDDRFYINDFSINPGETKQVEIMLDNTTTFTAIQADIYLPEGLTIEQEDGDYLFDLTSRKGRDHTVSSRVLSSGAIRILVASQNLKTFSGNSGALVTFNIIADESITGNKVIELKNVIASEVNQTEHSLPNTSCTVTVTQSTVLATGISLNKSELSLEVGSTETLVATVTPSNVTNGSVTWTSSNTAVATVNPNGMVTALATGRATIFAYTDDGTNHSASCLLTVTKGGVLGDVNGDIVVTAADVTALYNILLDDDWAGVVNADQNGDGYVTRADVTAVYDVLLGNVPSNDEHEYVDLGLPSGTLWATVNIGASSSEEYGDYFAWGETTPKDVYNWSTYKWCNGNYDTLTKYCTLSSYGYNSFTDGKTELDPEDDAATANWGSKWRMPTKAQQDELRAECTWQWTTRNGVNGCLVTSKYNGASLFMPAAGYRWKNSLGNVGTEGCYRSRTLESSTPNNSYSQDFNSEGVDCYESSRSSGRTVRAVRVP